MITRPTVAAALFTLAAAGTVANAQTGGITPTAPILDAATMNQLVKDMRAERKDVIDGTMDFTKDEEAKFWPLYKKYEPRRRAVSDEKVALVKDFTASYEGLTDAKAAELLGRIISVEDKATALKREFVRDLQKVLPAKTVARYYQVDNRLDLLASMEFSSRIPIAK